MADISVPEIIYFDISLEQDYTGQQVMAETILKDMYIVFDDPYDDAAKLTFCVWFRIIPTVHDDFTMEGYLEQRYSLSPVEKISPTDLHYCVTDCSNKLQETLKALYTELGRAPVIVPMRYDEGFFKELVEKIKFQAFGAGFDFGSF